MFSLERNATVRSRLTHTLEVATYGALIGERIARHLVSERLLPPELVYPLVLVVENACLLHDVGNPPFGHLGEYAIRAWFSRNTRSLDKLWRECGIDKATRLQFAEAYQAFDGNAQGFRIITRLQWLTDEYGLNLTSALLATSLKYLSYETSSRAFESKIGFFPSELSIVKEVRKQAELVSSADGQMRHPLAFVVEAADDIAYGVSDIEDAIEKKVIAEGDFFRLLSRLSPDLRRFDQGKKAASDLPRARIARFIRFRIELTQYLVQRAYEIFRRHLGDLIRGRFTESLLKKDELAATALQALESVAQSRIFVAPEAVNIELAGHRIVDDILETMRPLLDLDPGDFKELLERGQDGVRRPKQKAKHADLALEIRLAALLPARYVNLYRFSVVANKDLERIYRTQLLVDYVAGMTDTHALQVHDMLMGNVHGLRS